MRIKWKRLKPKKMWLIINNEGNPVTSGFNQIWIFADKEDAKRLIYVRKDVDKKYGRTRKIVEVNLLYNK